MSYMKLVAYYLEHPDEAHKPLWTTNSPAERSAMLAARSRIAYARWKPEGEAEVFRSAEHDERVTSFAETE